MKKKFRVTFGLGGGRVEERESFIIKIVCLAYILLLVLVAKVLANKVR